eukprot:1146217-Pelagomonas_calceolata.AAC.7
MNKLNKLFLHLGQREAHQVYQTAAATAHARFNSLKTTRKNVPLTLKQTYKKKGVYESGKIGVTATIYITGRTLRMHMVLLSYSAAYRRWNTVKTNVTQVHHDRVQNMRRVYGSLVRTPACAPI